MSERRSLPEHSDEEGTEINVVIQHRCTNVRIIPLAPPDVADNVDSSTVSETTQTSNKIAEDLVNEETQCGLYSETIQRLCSDLTSIVDIQYGLLDELSAGDVITQQQLEEVTSQPVMAKRIDRLLNLVVKMPDALQEQFLDALDNNQQMHVSELIRAQGNVESLNGDRRPLRYCTEVKMLTKNRVKLIDLIDLKCGLLDELYSKGFVNDRQMQHIRAGQTDTDQNTRLLDILLRKSFGDLKAVADCLITTKQPTVARLMSESYQCTDEPLSDERKSLLKTNYATLITLIQNDCGLLAELFQADCISQRHKQFIESAVSESERNARLLDIMRRGSESDYNKFIDCLSKTGQNPVANILQKGGVVLHVDAVTSGTASEETLIVERIMGYIADTVGNCSNARKDSVYAKVVQHVNELRRRDVDVIAAVKQNSIGMFYLCRSLDGLQHLYDLYFSGELNRMLEQVFTSLLSEGEPVVVHSLHWDVRDYMNGWHCLYAKANLRVFSELYEMASNTLCGSVGCKVCSLRVEEYPFELLQLILTKATGQLFNSILKVTPLAAVYAVATAGSVSKLWWRTLTYRRYTKLLTRRYFQRVCSPFKCIPRRLSSLHVEDVGCFSEFNGELYVGVRSCASILVFVNKPPFRQLNDIKGFDNPSDIVVCRDTSSLYVADRGSQYAIWRVNLLSNKQIEKFLAIPWKPWSLSVYSSRLLITSYNGRELFLYSVDGSQLNRVKVPRHIVVTHAVETADNTYIVCHHKRWSYEAQSEYNGVSELDGKGQVIRTFNSQNIDIGPIELNQPTYLALDGSNHVIVADSRNERVVVLKANLQMKRVLIPSLDGQPMRLYLSKSTGLLLVSCMYSSDIRIYEVCNSER